MIVDASPGGTVRWWMMAVFASLLTAAPVGAADAVVEHFDGVLGTSMDITVIGAPPRQARSAIGWVVAEVKRLERLLSSYRSDSEVSRLNRMRELERPSAELRALIERCAYWSQASRNRFSCKLGRIQTAWRTAKEAQVLPDRVKVRRLARDIAKARLATDADQSDTLRLPDLVDIDLGGIAKGFIIDRVLDALRQRLPKAVALKVDIGGDARYWGGPPDSDGWRIGIGPDGRDGQIVVRDVAVAASGHTERGFRIGRQHYSHILAPRDGWPVDEAPAAFVTARNASAADAVATALVNMGPQEAMSWVATLPDVEALLVLTNGTQLASPGWRVQQRLVGGARPAARLRVDYTIPHVRAGEYRRPYVAIWITDAERQVVRNLLLLGESHRWAQENSRWWRQVGKRNRTVLDGFALATRRPGSYVVTWDGYDDHGRLTAEQSLVLHIEAAREYGGHDYHRIAIDTRQPVREQRAPQGEIGAIDVQWVTNPELASVP